MVETIRVAAIWQWRTTTTPLSLLSSREAFAWRSLPLDIKIGDSIPGGATNLDARIIVKATKAWNDSTLNKIVQLTEEARLNKPKLQRWLDQFGEQYSKVVVVLSVAIPLIVPFLFKWPFFGTSAIIRRIDVESYTSVHTLNMFSPMIEQPNSSARPKLIGAASIALLSLSWVSSGMFEIFHGIELKRDIGYDERGQRLISVMLVQPNRLKIKFSKGDINTDPGISCGVGINDYIMSNTRVVASNKRVSTWNVGYQKEKKQKTETSVLAMCSSILEDLISHEFEISSDKSLGRDHPCSATSRTGDKITNLEKLKHTKELEQGNMKLKLYHRFLPLSSVPVFKFMRETSFLLSTQFFWSLRKVNNLSDFFTQEKVRGRVPPEEVMIEVVSRRTKTKMESIQQRKREREATRVALDKCFSSITQVIAEAAIDQTLEYFEALERLCGYKPSCRFTRRGNHCYIESSGQVSLTHNWRSWVCS
ncbi:hypothetical protein G4B88_007224 [Cannabis sativa]|uniref:Uncharacterized protein n=1 Tax=Cannabis sativa TaxID=3483 RepID=A0A7J6FR60_CANSA|nr:hypothetical protein G4B88_007224 [Cannabis sativa]